MQWYLNVLKQYVAFSGRARRKEYWMFVLFSVIISLILTVVENLIGISPVLTGIYSLAVFLPSLGVLVRRLHDTGKSGWWALIGFIPFIGALVLIVLATLDSTPDNKYGPNPKTSSASV